MATDARSNPDYQAFVILHQFYPDFSSEQYKENREEYRDLAFTMLAEALEANQSMSLVKMIFEHLADNGMAAASPKELGEFLLKFWVESNKLRMDVEEFLKTGGFLAVRNTLANNFKPKLEIIQQVDGGM